MKKLSRSTMGLGSRRRSFLLCPALTIFWAADQSTKPKPEKKSAAEALIGPVLAFGSGGCG